MSQQLAPIALSELNDKAALQKRRDRKYALVTSDATMIADSMPAHTRILTIDGQSSFNYESVYFDTTGLTSWLTSARGRPHRFKVRTRHYVDTDQAFLEVKFRENRKTVKVRVPHDPRRLYEISPEQHGFLSGALQTARFGHVAPTWLQPTLATTYRRQTFYVGDARLTMDDSLAWTLPNGRTITRPNLAVVELKSSGRASEIDHWLWSLGHRPARLSKYCTGLAALNPQLPANRWHRTLNRHF